MHMMTREIIPGRKTEGSTVFSINCDRSSLNIFVLKRDVKLQLTNMGSRSPHLKGQFR